MSNQLADVNRVVSAFAETLRRTRHDEEADQQGHHRPAEQSRVHTPLLLANRGTDDARDWVPS